MVACVGVLGIHVAIYTAGSKLAQILGRSDFSLQEN